MTTSAHNYVKKNFNALELTGFFLSLPPLGVMAWHVDVMMAFVAIRSSRQQKYFSHSLKGSIEKT